MDPVSRADLVCLYLASLGGDGDGHGDRDGVGGGTWGADPGSDAGAAPGGAGRPTATVGGSGDGPAARSTAGVADALTTGGDTLADRIAVFSALRELADRGLVETAQRRIPGEGGERTVHHLTAEGRAHAADLRERLSGETVTVRRDGIESVPLSAMGEYFEDRPMVEALLRVGEEGILDLERGVEGAFVDRSAELEQLTDRLSSVRADGGRTVLVSGPPGVGKSELVAEVADRAEERGFAVLVGRAPGDGAEPYEPFRRALAELPDADGIVGELADPEGPPVEDGDDLSVERSALQYDVAAAVREAAGDRPLLLVVEDLDRADRASLALFRSLAERVAEWLPPVLLVGVHRPTARGPLSGTVERLEATDRVERVALDPFEEGHVRELVAGAVGRPDVPREFVAAVEDRTGGVPLFVVESVAHLVEAGAVDPDAGRFPPDAVEETVPAAVEDLVAARLAALDDGARHLLRVGSVVGEVVPVGVVERVAELSPARVRDYADLLVESGTWTREDGDPAFVSGVLREAVYATIAPERRRELHRAVAAAIEEAGDRADGGSVRVARHYRRAGEHEAAVDAYEAAADRAERAYAYEDAVQRYREALEVVEADDRAGRLHCRAGEAHRVLGEYEAAVEQFERARDRADDPPTLARAADGLGSVRVYQGRHERARDALASGLSAVADRDGDDARRWEAELLIREGWSHLQAGDLEAARSTMERAATIARELDDPGVLGRAANQLSTVEARSGDFDAAAERLRMAIDLCERAGDRRVRARATANLGIVHWRWGETEEALELLREADDLHEEIGLTAGRERIRSNLGIVAKSRGDPGAALEHYEAGLSTARRVGNRESVANLHSNAGNALEALGRLDEAAERFERSRSVAAELDNPRRVAVATLNRGWIDLHRGDYDDARERAREAARRLSGTGNEAKERDVDRLRGVISRVTGDPDAAVERHREVLTAAEEAEDLTGACSASRQLARDHLAAGDADRALERARDARDLDVDDAGHRVRNRSVLAAALRATGDLDAAREHAREGLADAREHGFRVVVPGFLTELARIERDGGDPGAAREYAREGRELAGSMGLDPVFEDCRDLLAELPAPE